MKIDRRRVLQTTAAVLTATSVLKLTEKTGTLTLVDATLSERELHVAGASVGTNAKKILPDLVRQWRDGLGARIVSAETVTAYVRWDKALLLVGLARESRMAYRTVQLDRSVFAVRFSTLG
jgi:hypothetical protein